MSSPEKHKLFVEQMESDLSSGVKYYSKSQVEKVALKYGIDNKNLIKELTELAIVNTARKIINASETTKQAFDGVVHLYYQQVNLSQRTSMSMMLQQYSTPAPISYLAGFYVKGINKQYFEPSAGNGLLTIALNPKQVCVNEIDDIRNANLKTQGFMNVTRISAVKDLATDLGYFHLFDGIITNPPFGPLGGAVEFNGFPIITLDHLMCIRALDCMKDDGRASMIIGGHTTWDEKGRVLAGKNRIFFNYLYRYYNVDDVIQINGKKLYSRQGTAFDTRLILIDGRKAKPEGNAPLHNPANDAEIVDFDNLFNRVMLSAIPGVYDDVDRFKKRMRLASAKASAKLKLLELLK